MMEKTLAQRVRTVLDNIGRHTQYGGVYYDFGNAESLTPGHGLCRFCHYCVQHSRTGGFCRNSAATAAVQGHAIGDSWYFRCWLGIDSIAVPVAPQGDVIGAIEIGGFFSPGGTQQAQQVILSRLASVAAGDSFEAITRSMQGIRELDFKQVKAIADFALEATFAEGLNDAATFSVRHQIYLQQERLAARIGKLQDSEPDAGQKTDCLKNLRQKMQAGDRHAIFIALDDFLGHVLLEAGDRTDAVRANILLLTSFLFQGSIQAGMDWKTHIHEYEKQVTEIGSRETIEELCFWTERAVLKQYEQNRERARKEPSTPPVSERLLAWMRRNYRRKLTIADAADEIGASTSTITHAVKRETGQTFATHLNGLRVSEAKRLLAYSNLSLAEVGNYCGFSDQSYFTKVFRRTVNMTPSSFRGMLDNRDLQGTSS